jgi:tetratricopeptide (TPR) repeat protein
MNKYSVFVSKWHSADAEIQIGSAWENITIFDWIKLEEQSDSGDDSWAAEFIEYFTGGETEAKVTGGAWLPIAVLGMIESSYLESLAEMGHRGFLAIDIAGTHQKEAVLWVFESEIRILSSSVSALKLRVKGEDGASDLVASGSAEEVELSGDPELDEIQLSPFRKVWSESYKKMGTDLAGTIHDLAEMHVAMPGNTVIIRSLATLLARSGDLAYSQELVEKGLEIKPGDFALLRDLGNHWLQTGKLDEALAVAERIESFLKSTGEQDDEDALAAPSAIRGLVFAQQGKKKEAREKLEEAHSISYMIFLDFEAFQSTLALAQSEDW